MIDPGGDFKVLALAGSERCGGESRPAGCMAL
jgi:hypothetical protein